MVRWSGYEMLFACGIAGVLIAGLTLPIAKVAGDTLSFWPKDIGVGTTAGVLGIPAGFSLATAINAWPGTEKRRLRRLRALAESNTNLIEVLLYDAIEGRWFMELTLESRKSYVGLPVRIENVASAEALAIQLVPVFSGYRTGEAQELYLTRYYGDDISPLADDATIEQKGLAPRDLRVVIPLRQVVSARLFDPEVYDQMNPTQS